MNRSFYKQPDGYRETIEAGMAGVQRFRKGLVGAAADQEQAVRRLREELRTADAIVLGAGAGLSTSAGLTYSGERFDRYFFDFRDRYGIQDMYSGGFYPFQKDEVRWAWWARHIYFNRFIDPPRPVYRNLRALVKDREYFIVTTNVDHQFQRAGFDKARLFYTQGDYGLFQSADPERIRRLPGTYDNEDWVLRAMEAQGFVRNGEGGFELPEDRGQLRMEIPSVLIPECPEDGSPVTMNLRADDTFVEDAGWHRAAAAYADFLQKHQGEHVLFLEMGVGMNTPVIIKYPFWQMTEENENAFYACLNLQEAYCPAEIAERAICIQGDLGEILEKLLQTV